MKKSRVAPPEPVRVDAVARLQWYMTPRHDEAPADPPAAGEPLAQLGNVRHDDDGDGIEEFDPTEPEPEARVEVNSMTNEQHPQGLRADLDKAPSEVAAMFDRVARRYDLVNDLLALGQTRIWRNLVLRAVDPQPGERILDLAAGTGTSSAPFAAKGAEVVPCDFSLGMLQEGKRRQPQLPFVAGDALNLPFRDGVFDAVTISFGLRNVQDTHRALSEMLRVTKPGGTLVICEFSSPTNRHLRTLYSEYLMKALPGIARRTSSNPAAYVYLAESISSWPGQAALAQRIREAGWLRPQWRNATGGIVAIHRAFKAE